MSEKKHNSYTIVLGQNAILELSGAHPTKGGFLISAGRMMETTASGISEGRETGPQEPMTIGGIIDRALRISPVLFLHALVPFSVIAALTVAAELPSVVAVPGLAVACTILSTIINFFVSITAMKMAGHYWNGERTSFRQATSGISLGFAFRFFCLGIAIGLGMIARLLLLIIPGLVYALNRSLAPYIMLLEDAPISEALRKSKALITKKSFANYMRLSAIFFVVLIISVVGSSLQEGVRPALADTIVGRKFAAVVQFAAVLIVLFSQAFNYLCYAGLYFDLTARYEGVDLAQELEGLNS